MNSTKLLVVQWVVGLNKELRFDDDIHYYCCKICICVSSTRRFNNMAFNFIVDLMQFNSLHDTMDIDSYNSGQTLQTNTTEHNFSRSE